MRMKGVRSLREMTKLLDIDQRLRKLCLIRTGEKSYSRSVLSRFTRKIGEDDLNKIIDEKVVSLLKNNPAKEVDIVLDASFIKTWSTRDPIENQSAREFGSFLKNSSFQFDHKNKWVLGQTSARYGCSNHIRMKKYRA